MKQFLSSLLSQGNLSQKQDVRSQSTPQLAEASIKKSKLDKLGTISSEDIPDETVLDERFEKAMKELALPQDKVDIMKAFSRDSK